MNVTKADVLALLREVVEEKGEDYRYQNPDIPFDPNRPGDNCMYVHALDDGPVPGCIAGQVFVKLGVPLDALSLWERKSSRFVAEKIHDEFDIVFDVEANRALTRAQRAQDRGWTWGTALQAAQNEVEIAGVDEEQFLAGGYQATW